MSKKKTVLAIVLMVLILAAVAGGLFWHMQHYQMIDFIFYPKDAELLDLRQEEISFSHYNKIRRDLPQTRVLWNVPFQDAAYANDIQELTVTQLTEANVSTLDYFPQLQVLHAADCRDYQQLLSLQQRRPELTIEYALQIGGQVFLPGTTEITLSDITPEELKNLPLLQQLTAITVDGCPNIQNIAALQEFCHDKGYVFRLCIGDTVMEEDVQQITVSNVQEADLPMLQFLPNLQKLELVTPAASVESLLQLQKTYPQTEISWTQSVAGKLFPHTETLIDISNIEVTDLDAVAQAMTYFPDATQLEMHHCGVENEAMAAFREAHREDYKVVWTVFLGPKLPTRTDTTSIMPARDGTSVFHDEEAYNMRYCEDVIAVDVGHLDVRNVEWAAFMPHLKYLILAWTGVRDLTPLGNCKELVWLELDYSPVKDTTPLIGCTALEDINIGASGIDPAGLCQMPWLKNVWAIFNPGAGYQVAQACPDTRVVATGTHTVSSGWRHLPNYYAMRDALNMFYMDQ